jgi:hypothetical protein
VAFLIAGRIGTKHKYGPMRAIADQPDTRPEVDGVRDPVSTLGDKDDATACRSGRVINRGLDCWRIVGDTIGRGTIGPVLQVRRVWIRGTLGEDGLREQGRRSGEKQKNEEE